MANLRKLLGVQPDGSDWIATVARVGYRFAGSIDGIVGTAPSPRRPVVAVLPFAGGDGEPATGTTEAIAIALARFHWFAVTRRADPLADYQLQGSVRKGPGDSIRISVHLVDGSRGTDLWAERYELQSAELFAIQDEIARRVAGAIEPALLQADTSRAAVAEGTGAWDLVRRGTWLFHQITRPTHLEARERFRQASELDPLLAEAHAWLARVSAGILAYGWSDNPAADGAEGIRAGLQAVRLDERNPYAHYGLAIVSVYAGEPQQARRAAERAVELSDSFALGHLVLGLAELACGNPAAAIVPLRRGLELSPGDPQNFAWLNFLALAQLFSNDAAGATATAGQLLKIRPDWRPGYQTLTCGEVMLGRIDAARTIVAHMASLPVISGDTLAPILTANPDWAKRLEDLFQRACSPA